MTLAQLPARWRDRAIALERFGPGAAAAFRDAAMELETALQNAAEVQTAALKRAEEFVLVQLRAGSKSLTTSELRTAARGNRISNANCARALKILRSRGAIAFEPGARGARLWFATRDRDISQWQSERSTTDVEGTAADCREGAA